MRDDEPPESGASAGAGLSRRVPTQTSVPLEIEAFYLGRQEFYHSYAEAQLGNRRAAEDAVDDAFAELLADWAELLREGNLEQRAWSVLRRVIRERLEDAGRLPAYTVNGPIAQVLRAAQGKLADLHSDYGLFAAIAQLPPRQCDVIVLRHILGHETRTVARFMGLDERTVDYHHRRAKDRLWRLLRLSEPTANRIHRNEEDR